jgi:hypothetical protein
MNARRTLLQPLRFRWRTAILVIAIVVLSALVAPLGEAQARPWFWSEAKAERLLVRAFSDVRAPWCTGYGHWYLNGGVAYYNRFACTATIVGVGRRTVQVIATGRRHGRLIYGWRVLRF